MGFGNSEQNFGMIASKFTVAMWYTDRYVSPVWSIGGFMAVLWVAL